MREIDPLITSGQGSSAARRVVRGQRKSDWTDLTINFLVCHSIHPEILKVLSACERSALNQVRALAEIIFSTSLFLFLEIFASLRQQQKRAPAFPSSLPKHLLREQHQGLDIFWHFVPQNPISEVSFSLR